MVLRSKLLDQLLRTRIVILDGGGGTHLINLLSQESGGSAIVPAGANWQGDLEFMPIDRPELIRGMHRDFLDAGADIILTHSFVASWFWIAGHPRGISAYNLNYRAAQLARRVALAAERADPDRPRFVAGSIGPPWVQMGETVPGGPVTETDLAEDDILKSFREQIGGLLNGGVDLLILETQIRSRDALLGLDAAEGIFSELGKEYPVWVSFDAKHERELGRFVQEVSARSRTSILSAVGVNCGQGPDSCESTLRRVLLDCPFRVIAYPSAGLPDKHGEYPWTPDSFAQIMADFGSSGLVNVAGGCCGTKPEHISRLSRSLNGISPRDIPSR